MPYFNTATNNLFLVRNIDESRRACLRDIVPTDPYFAQTSYFVE